MSAKPSNPRGAPAKPGPAHHLRTVLRLGPGAAVAGFNAPRRRMSVPGLAGSAGSGWRSRRAAVPAARAEPDLWLLFAPIKRAHLDWLVEKATELGVGAFLPVWTERTQPERLNLDLLGITCGRGGGAERAVVGAGVVSAGKARPAGCRMAGGVPLFLYVCDETGGGVPLATCKGPVIPPALLVGPEGGFAETELDAI